MRGRAASQGRDAVDDIVGQWNIERKELETSAMGLFGRLYRCAAAAGANMEAVYGRFGITRADFDVLATIVRGGPPYRASPGAITESLMLSSGGMTRRLDRLERLALIAREADPSDRRASLVVITDRGHELLDEALLAGVEAQGAMLGGLSVEERRCLDESLRQLLRSIDAFGSGANA